MAPAAHLTVTVERSQDVLERIVMMDLDSQPRLCRVSNGALDERTLVWSGLAPGRWLLGPESVLNWLSGFPAGEAELARASRALSAVQVVTLGHRERHQARAVQPGAGFIVGSIRVKGDDVPEGAIHVAPKGLQAYTTGPLRMPIRSKFVFGPLVPGHYVITFRNRIDMILGAADVAVRDGMTSEVAWEPTWARLVVERESVAERAVVTVRRRKELVYRGVLLVGAARYAIDLPLGTYTVTLDENPNVKEVTITGENPTVVVSIH